MVQDLQSRPADDVEFARIVSPLELRFRRRLSGPWRSRCLRAFAEDPAGFADCATRALAKARSNPLGLLVRMVGDGDHLLPAHAPPELRHPVDDCMRCGNTQPLHEVGDELLCAVCAVDAAAA